MTSTTSHDDFERRYFSGGRVYGDDFTLAQIEEWYQREEAGYYDLKQGDRTYSYGDHALNRLHGFSALRSGAAYNSAMLAFADALPSRAFAWNLHYHRDTPFKKVAPGAVFYVLEKQ